MKQNKTTPIQIETSQFGPLPQGKGFIDKVAAAVTRRNKEKNYWLKQLSGELQITNFPYDYKRKNINTYHPGTNVESHFIISDEHFKRLMKISGQSDNRLYIILVAAVIVLLEKYSGISDIIVGAPIFKQEIQGEFINNLLAFRTQIHEDTSFKGLLADLRETIAQAQDNQNYPLETLPGQLNISSPGHDQLILFDLAVLLENIQDKDYLRTANPGMIFSFLKNSELLRGTIEYNPLLYKRTTIEQIKHHLTKQLETLIYQPDVPVVRVEILSPQEKNRLINELNNTAADFPDKTLHDLFAEQVERIPDRVAVMGTHQIHQKGPEEYAPLPVPAAITYHELNKRSNQLANYLSLEKHVQPEELVGVLMDRSPFLVTALLGILKAGGVYVPLDPDYPEERLKNVIKDASIKTVISQSGKIKTLNRLQWECPSFHTFLCLDSTDVYCEQEKEKSGLMDRSLWEYIGESAVDDITAGGWLTGTTGQPFTRQEMDEYGDNVLKKLKPLLHQNMRILEIGCASGLTMYRIAPLVGFYYGTDLSRLIIEKNRKQIHQHGYTNIKLAYLPAHEIHQLQSEEKDFDLVIINSVIQSFHGHNYLRSVIRQVVDLTANKGILFIGDIMDQDLKEELIHYMKEFKRLNTGKNYLTKTDWSEELFLSRAFFHDLTIDFPEIQQVEFSDKIYTIENELTLFRYDTLIKVDKKTRRNKPGEIKTKHKYQEDTTALQKLSLDPPPMKTIPRQLAYVIYTSGSSGKPKGVTISHINVARLAKNSNFIQWQEGDRLLPTGSISFDISTFEIWAPLLNGICLVLADKEIILNDRWFEQVIQSYRVTHLHLIPQLFTQLADQRPNIFSRLRYFLVGGDLVKPREVNKIRRKFNHLKILHMYGPTENTTFSTFFPIEQEYENSLPIGRPITNSTVYILDKYHRLQPVGVYGELCSGGWGVARGYLNNPELTAKKFDHDLWDYPDYHLIKNHKSQITKKSIHQLPPNGATSNKKFLRGGPGGAVFSKSAPPGRRRQKLYHTGDLARWNRDSQLEFAGRIDRQVKIRGFRIETEEIENRLLEYSNIKKAIVTPRVDETGDPYLCAYIVPEDQENFKIEVSDLKFHLSGKLPDYMIPAVFVPLENIPLTNTGKVDQKSLPQPQWGDSENYLAPQNQIEKKLVNIWADILGIDRNQISIDTNFFQLGGHSLKATLLVTRIHKELDVQVPLSEIFTSQTIKELSQYIDNAVKKKFAAIEPVEEKEYYELSSAQKRLYILQQMELTGTAYNMPQIIPLSKEVDIKKLENTFKTLIQRHESLRTSFLTVNEKPVQKIHQEVQFEIEYFKVKRQEVHHASTIRDFTRPFDLSCTPLLRAGLIKTGESEHILMLDMHHIITDGTSMDILRNEFNLLYEREKLPLLKLRYRDFSRWQNHLFKEKSIKNQENFWLKTFHKEIPVLTLPYDYPRPLIQDFAGARVDFIVNEQHTRQLMRIAQKAGATLYMCILSIYIILLAKLSGQEDIIVGTPIAGRRHADLECIIGMLVNTLPIRNYPTGEKTFKQFLNEIKDRTLGSFENQDYQFEELVEKLAVRRDTSRNPIFDVMFNLINSSGPGSFNPDKKDQHKFEHKQGTSKFDLNLTALDRDDIEAKGLLFNLEYCTRLFKANTIERLIGYLKKIVSDLVKNPGLKLAEIGIMDEKEKYQLLVEFNRTAAQYPRDKTIHDLFAGQVEQTPDKIAVVGPLQLKYGTYMADMTYITYNQLNEKCNQLSYFLKKQGTRPDTIVGIMTEPSIEMLIGILAILKAGGAYLPIDPDYPQERINYMVADSAAKILLTTEAINRVPTPPHLNLPPEPAACLTYIIYTSGSTGKPKGVMVERPSVINVLSALFKMYPFLETHSFLLKTSFTFDVSVSELFGWFWGGGRLIVLGKDDYKDPQKILDTIERYRITHINFVPSMFGVFIEQLDHQNMEKISSLKYIFLAGEALPQNQVKKFRQINTEIVLENLYGPTEGTIYASAYSLSQWSGNGNIPIGKPLQNTSLYIFDRNHYPVPIGVIGELFIGGHGVARGYLNNPELTSRKFQMPNKSGYNRSYKSYKSYILYQTGDLTHWLPDGNIEFLGRIDQQVKIRGFRIELEEIETHIKNHQKVKEAIVIPVEKFEKSTDTGNTPDKYLCAYLVASGEINTPELKTFLSRRLPGYMIPSYFVQLGKIPLTPSGKVDKNSLPPPEIKADKGYIAPRNDVEQKLKELWLEVLNIDKDALPATTIQSLSGPLIGIDDNFFDLGGHSLNATILATKIHKAFHTKISLAQIFKSPTIRGISDFIKKTDKTQFISLAPVEKKEYYPLSSSQKQFFLIQQINPTTVTYNLPSILKVEGTIEKEKPRNSFHRLIQRHETLRTSFLVINQDAVQQVHDQVEFAIEYHEMKEAEPLINSFIRPFDLSQVPLLRVGLIKLAKNSHILMVDMHHILSDFFSQEILIREFVTLYLGETLPELKLQYKDYSHWQNRLVLSGEMKKQEDYWLKQLQGGIPAKEISTDFSRPQVRSFEGNSVKLEIGQKDIRELSFLAKKENVTLFMVFLAITNILFYKLDGREDITLGTVVAGRRHPDLENIIGAFVNTLVLRNTLKPNQTFLQFLKKVKEQTLDTFDNQDYRFEALVQKVLVHRDPTRNPLFDVLFSFATQGQRPDTTGKNQESNRQNTPDIRVEPVESQTDNEKVKFDLSLAGVNVGEQCHFLFSYSTKIFKKETIQRYAQYFKEIVTAVAADTNIPLKHIKLSTDLSLIVSNVYDKHSEFQF